MAGQEPSGTVDFGYLEGFAAGDRQVVADVLKLFLQQADIWAGSLDPAAAGWPDVVHTIKGAARGVGAHALGDICAQAEADGADGLPAVRTALAEAVTAIQAYLGRAA